MGEIKAEMQTLDEFSIESETLDEIVIETDKLDEILIELDEQLVISTTRNHAELENLDYESSGHTGFASSTDLEAETNRASTKENTLETAINSEISRATTKEGQIDNEIDIINGNIDTLSGGLSEQAQDIQELRNDLDSETTTRSSEDTRVLNEAKEYADQNGGKIDTIKVNNVALPITNKTVNITVPTDYATTSDLEDVENTLVERIEAIEDDYLTSTDKMDVLDRIEAVEGQIPTQLSQLAEDTTHRVVTDTEKNEWGSKAEQSSVDTNTQDIAQIGNKIPTEASEENKLADKAFVNSSIASNTANFKGTFTNIQQLPTTNVTNNDYAFVVSVDTAGNTQYNRYKYIGTAPTGHWEFEYILNNSSFTSEQWNAINSGINEEKVSQYETWGGTLANKLDKDTATGQHLYGHDGSTQKCYDILQAISNETDKIPSSNAVKVELDKKQNQISSTNKVAAANISGLSAVATSGSYDDLSDTPTIPSGDNLVSAQDRINWNLKANQYQITNLQDQIDGLSIPTKLSDLTSDTTHRTVTDTEKQTWNNKSNFSGSYTDLTNKPNLFSGSWNDLTDKPTIPDVSGKLDKRENGYELYSHNGQTQMGTQVVQGISSGTSEQAIPNVKGVKSYVEGITSDMETKTHASQTYQPIGNYQPAGNYIEINDDIEIPNDIYVDGVLRVFDDNGTLPDYRPENKIDENADLDTYIYSTGITAFDANSEDYYTYSFPAESGTFAMQESIAATYDTIASVNAKINSMSATFRGSFATKSALLAVAWQTTNPSGANFVSNNDYAFVEADESHSNEAWRYGYIAGTGWSAQYKINEVPITESVVSAWGFTKFSGNYNDLSNKPTIPDTSGLMPKSGGEFTGNVSGKYFQGTWLQSSAATENASYTDFWVNSGGWLYKRSKANVISDLGIVSESTIDSKISNHHDDTKQDVISATNKIPYSNISGTPTIPTVPNNLVVGSTQGYTIAVVDSLPANPNANTIYLIKE